MDFLYTVDPNAAEPIMLIDSHIGFDEEDGEGIMGDKFSRELMFLDTLNKKKIQIWINSPGGVVTDGQQIFGTILKTKTKIDTYCIGIAASIAFPLLLAGREVFMMDYAKGMVHPVSGGDSKTRAALEDSVVKMLTNRSNISEELIKQLMARTTWIGAKECENLGLCKVEDSGSLNIPRVASNDWKDYKKVTNKLVENIKPIKNDMKNVNNKLGLVDEANEASRIQAIDALINKVSNAEDKVSNLKKALDEAEAKYNALKEEHDKVSNEMKVAAEASAKVANEEKEKKAKDLVSNAVKVGKIQNKAEVITNLEKQAVENFDAVKDLLDAMGANKPGAKAGEVINKDGAASDTELSMVIAKEMHEIRNRMSK